MAGLTFAFATALLPAEVIADDLGGQPLPCRPLPLATELLPEGALQLPLPVPVTATSLIALDQDNPQVTASDLGERAESAEPETSDATLEEVFGERPPEPSLEEGGVSHREADADEDPVAVTANSADRAGATATQLTPSLDLAPVVDADPSAADAADGGAPPAVVTEPRPPMPTYVRALRTPLQRCLQWYERRPLNTLDDSPWSIMHALLGGGGEMQIRVGGPRGRWVRASEWLLQNQPCAGHRLFLLADDRIQGREGPGFQGHPAQCLAIFAQSGIPPHSPLMLGNRELSVTDLIEEEQRTCVADMELTFKLIGLSFYLDSDAQWQNEQGEPWDFPKLIRLELAQPINGVTCGGTHRLMGLTCAVARRKADGKPITDQWWRANRFVQDYHAYTLTLQNRDGSFSTDWFRGRANSGPLDRKLQTTGHVLEWLVYSVPDEMLYDAQNCPRRQLSDQPHDRTSL